MILACHILCHRPFCPRDRVLRALPHCWRPTGTSPVLFQLWQALRQDECPEMLGRGFSDMCPSPIKGYLCNIHPLGIREMQVANHVSPSADNGAIPTATSDAHPLTSCTGTNLRASPSKTPDWYASTFPGCGRIDRGYEDNDTQFHKGTCQLLDLSICASHFVSCRTVLYPVVGKPDEFRPKIQY